MASEPKKKKSEPETKTKPQVESAVAKKVSSDAGMGVETDKSRMNAKMLKNSLATTPLKSFQNPLSRPDDNASAIDGRGNKPLEVITDADPDEVQFINPGPLRSVSTLKIETRRGQMIFEGRRPNPDKGIEAIIGLRGFASYLNIIWKASAKNDPYADWWLLKVEREIEAKELYVNEKLLEYKALLEQTPNMTHEVAHSIKPVVRELRFKIPYSFRGATLLMKHDELTKTIMTAHHVGLVDSSKSYTELEESAKLLRTAFQCVTQYRFTGVTRDDVLVENPVARKAYDIMGWCPVDILEDKVVPKFQPTTAIMLQKLRRGSFHKHRQAEILAQKKKGDSHIPK